MAFLKSVYEKKEKFGQAADTCIMFGKSQTPNLGDEKEILFISISKIVAGTEWVNKAIVINLN